MGLLFLICMGARLFPLSGPAESSKDEFHKRNYLFVISQLLARSGCAKLHPMKIYDPTSPEPVERRNLHKALRRRSAFMFFGVQIHGYHRSGQKLSSLTAREGYRYAVRGRRDEHHPKFGEEAACATCPAGNLGVLVQRRRRRCTAAAAAHPGSGLPKAASRAI